MNLPRTRGRAIHPTTGLAFDGEFEDRLQRARRYLTDPYFQLFDGVLVQDHAALLADPSSVEAKLDFVTTYHMVIEGTLALTGQHFQTMRLQRRGILPGHLEAFKRIAQDEHRHVAYGTWYLQHKVRDPLLARRVQDKLAQTLPAAAGVGFPRSPPEARVRCNRGITALCRCYRRSRKTPRVVSPRAPRSLAIALSVAAAGLLLAACGSSSKSSAAASASPSRLSFSNCMRAHGVTNFPDPSSSGELAITPSSGINPFSPAFEAAQKACGGGPGNGGPPKMSEAQRLAALHFAECMRSHGVPNFPDPADGAALPNGPVLALRGMLFAGSAAFNPRSEAFKHGAVACGVRLP